MPEVRPFSVYCQRAKVSCDQAFGMKGIGSFTYAANQSGQPRLSAGLRIVSRQNTPEEMIGRRPIWARHSSTQPRAHSSVAVGERRPAAPASPGPAHQGGRRARARLLA